MQIVTDLLQRIEGVFWFPIVALFIFLLIFALMTFHAFSLGKSFEEELSRMPLDDNESDNFNESKTL